MRFRFHCFAIWLVAVTSTIAIAETPESVTPSAAEATVSPDVETIPGHVLVTFSEGLPSHAHWPSSDEEWPRETARWIGDEFLLPRIPQRYDEWGLRAAWDGPILIRMSADVPLSSGKLQFLIRARSLSRLWVNGQLVAETAAITHKPPDGEEPVTPVRAPPAPGVRPAGYHQQESTGEVTAAENTGLTRVVFELIAGGPNYRTETGEVCVALFDAEAESYAILRPSRPFLPLRDATIEPVLLEIVRRLDLHDDSVRRQAAASRDAYWEERHGAARRWAMENMVPEDVAVVHGGTHPIDTFIRKKLERARAAEANGDDNADPRFHNHVLPVLRDRCFRCHGKKTRGGLALDSHAAMMRGGDSGVSVVVAGEPDASELLARVRSDDESIRMPPEGRPLTAEQVAAIEAWIRAGAAWPERIEPPDEPAPVISDSVFLRRVHLDLIGLPPEVSEVESFLADQAPGKRERLVQRLLHDERSADHWMSFWLDLLAENPTLINQSLNSTGPFRWFLYDALRDNKPLDRMVTELILMRGGEYHGGSAGFGLAGENDSPLAEKAHILASAFLAIELECARCHDSPYHATTQRDLYSLAAMLGRKEMAVPETSRVPTEFFLHSAQTREPLIEVSLEPDAVIPPRWPFAATTGVRDDVSVDALMEQPGDSRERLAALVTGPQNERFPRVMVNRIWQRLMGSGIVEPVHDWERAEPSHADLLDWLARELVTHQYDVRHVIQLICSSQAYQREAVGRNKEASARNRYFTAPDPRRLTAEQVVDSLHAVTESPMKVEELTFVHDGRRPLGKRLTLGAPKRAWMFASLNNERDRPSLSLPYAQSVVDVLEAFGWTGSRQQPIKERSDDVNVLQPGVLANGTLTASLIRVAHGSHLAELAATADSPQALVERMFLKVLTRYPTPQETELFTAELTRGFATRRLSPNEVSLPVPSTKLPLVTWFNHQRPDATTIQKEVARRVLEGPAVDPQFRTGWRETFEDFVWSLINNRDFVWVP